MILKKLQTIKREIDIIGQNENQLNDGRYMKKQNLQLRKTAQKIEELEDQLFSIGFPSEYIEIIHRIKSKILAQEENLTIRQINVDENSE